MKENFTERPLSPLRKMIAARTLETVLTVPHFRLHLDVEVDSLREARREQQRNRPASRLTMNDLLIKACARALEESPRLNVQLVDGRIRDMHSVDIAVVVALDDGLSTPIVRECERKSVWEIAEEVRTLTARARAGALRTDEIFGGSFSISNLGMFGIPDFDAIVNPPQCAILAVGAARATVMPGRESGIRMASVMRVTLSCDHRAIDGAAGANFLRSLGKGLEEPAQLF